METRAAVESARRSPAHSRAEGIVVVAVFLLLLVLPAGVTPLATSDVWSYSAHAHGIISQLSVRGPADRAPHTVWVWRPPGPDSARIPVLYFLHGNPGGARDAFRHGLAAILDHRLLDGYPPFVVACPDGNGEHHSDTEWANSADGTDMVESRLLDAVIPAVEGADERSEARRAIVGFSMGGYGAMNIALRHPGEFGQIVSIAGYFHVDDPSGMFAGRRSLIAANSPARHLGMARGKHILLAEARSDELPAIKGQAAWFKRLLNRAHIPATFRMTAGRHDWRYASRALARALGFLASGWEHVPASRRLHGRPGHGRPVLRRIRVDAVLEQQLHAGGRRGDLTAFQPLAQLGR
jgi:S-formylglutathione hydrolase FrmB